VLPKSITSLAAGGEFFAIDHAREQGLSYDPTLLPQHDFADWFLYLVRVLHRRSYAERFAILSAASIVAVQASHDRSLTATQADTLANDLATAYEYAELDHDTHTAYAVLVLAFLNARPDA